MPKEISNGYYFSVGCLRLVTTVVLECPMGALPGTLSSSIQLRDAELHHDRTDKHFSHLNACAGEHAASQTKAKQGELQHFLALAVAAVSVLCRTVKGSRGLNV